MRLKAPAGVGDPCIAGVTIAPRDGLYEVEVEIGAHARRYESGVYADEVLQHYFPPTMAVISNIAAG